jgi:hypothetical protein
MKQEPGQSSLSSQSIPALTKIKYFRAVFARGNKLLLCRELSGTVLFCDKAGFKGKGLTERLY